MEIFLTKNREDGGTDMRRKMRALFQNGDKDTFAHAE